MYTFRLASKTDLTSLKAKVDKLNVNKLKTVPVDLNKLSNVVDNDVVKKTVMNWSSESVLLILRYQALVD